MADLASAASQVVESAAYVATPAQDNWTAFLLQTLRGQVNPDDILATKRGIYDRFAKEVARLAGPNCIATSIRILNKQGDLLGYAECYSPCNAWTQTAKDTMYRRDTKSIGWRVIESGNTEYVSDVSRDHVYIRVLKDGKSAMERCFSVRGEPRGVIATDWKVVNGAPFGFQARFEDLVAQLELILAWMHSIWR